MLAISPLRSNQDGHNREGDTSIIMESNLYYLATKNHEFLDFSGSNLLDSIDFDDLSMGMHNSSDGLPDLEMDPELLAEFSLSGGEEEYSTMSSIENMVSPNSFFDGNVDYMLDGHESGNTIDNNVVNEAIKVEKEVEIQSRKKNDSESESINGGHNKKHRSSTSTKMGGNNNNNSNNNCSNQGKRKTKVDWTPELHRRFVQAVEQLGVDKAVPSRILELMGIDCLTRHNIASHLQKYRSHRKHLLAREAEAASWTQKRQMYGVVMGGAKGGANISPWPHPPIIGFPPMTTIHQPFRPLHVWGHPSIDPRTRMPMWPKSVVPPTPPPWTPHPPPVDPTLWHSSHHRKLQAAPVPAPDILPHAMYRPERSLPPTPTPLSRPTNSLDPHPSKETVDAALGDALSKPWLPLPIGLKPPSMDSVLIELQRQGVSKIPPSST